MGVVAIVTVIVAFAYTQTDGGSWAIERMTRLRGQLILIIDVALILILCGASIAVLAIRNRNLILSGIFLAGSALLVATSNLMAKLTELVDAADWLRITILLIAGSSWGLGWGLGAKVGRTYPPLWSLLLPFLISALLITILSNSATKSLALIWLLLLSISIGRAGFQLLSVHASSNNRRVNNLVAFGLGLTVLSAAGFALGVAELAHPRALLFTILLITFSLLMHIWVLVKENIFSLSASCLSYSATCSMLYGLLSAVLLAQWMACLAPETGPDALGGRVALPLMWLNGGAVRGYPELIYSYASLAGETLYLLFLPIANNSVAKITAFACQLIIVKEILGSSRHLKNLWRIAATIAFASSTIVWWQLIHGFVDLLQAVLIVGAMESLRRWLKSKSLRDLLLSGLLAGSSTAVKLNGVIAITLVCGYVFLSLIIRRHSVWEATRSSLIAAFAAVIALLPWLIRSLILTGNPIFPFANWLFKSPLISRELVAKHFGEPFGFEAFRAIFDIFLSPGKYVEIGSYHPFFLALAVGFCLIIPVANKVVKFWAIMFMLAALAWLVSEPNLRYSLYVGLFAALAISRISIVRGLSIVIRPTISLFAAASLFIGCVGQLARPASWLWSSNNNPSFPLNWAIGNQTDDSFLRANLATYPMAIAFNETVDTGTRLWEMPWIRDHLYFRGTTVSSPHGSLPLLSPLAELLPGQFPPLRSAEIFNKLRLSGITHLLFDVENQWLLNVPESEWPGIFSHEFTKGWLNIIATNQNLRLYRLHDHSVNEETSTSLLEDVILPVDTNLECKVSEGQLLEIVFEPTLSSGEKDSYLNLAWYSPSGKLLLYQPHNLSFVRVGTWHRWLQTVPPGAARLVVYVRVLKSHGNIRLNKLLGSSKAYGSSKTY